MRATSLQFLVEAGDGEQYAIIVMGPEPPYSEVYSVSVADLSETLLYGVTGQPMNKIHAASGIEEWPIAVEKGVEKVLELIEQKTHVDGENPE
jgi:hypothetical protein